MKPQLKQTITTFSLLTFFALLPISCDMICKDSCGCGKTTAPSSFQILSFEVLTLDKDRNEVNPSEFFPYNEIVKAISIKESEILAKIEPPITFSTIPGIAFACSPLPPLANKRISSIQIINTELAMLNDGEILEIGDDLTTRFGINYLYNTGAMSIAEFFQEKKPVYYGDFFKLSWLNAPERELMLDFSIRIIMEDGTEFSMNHEKLSIK